MLRIILSIGLVGALCTGVLAQTTEFTFQGNLKTGTPPNTVPANGNYDFEFSLFDALSGGTQLGATLTRNSVAVDAGSFSVKLDFGAQFPGANRFLAISVRQTGGGAFQPLTPRQQISTAPYAVRSSNAANADNATNATSATTATNALQLGGVAANQYLLTNGNGSALTNLNAGNITTGTLALARGGTGSTTQNFVDLSSDQTSIGGNKTFNGTLSGNIVNAATQFNISGVRILSNGGNNNLFAGHGAGNAGTNNAYFGKDAGNLSTSFSGSNSFFGASAGFNNNDGGNNTFLGTSAGFNSTGSLANGNTFVGSLAGNGNTTGRGNTMIGFQADVPFPSVRNNATAVGSRAFVTQDNSLVLGSINGVNNANADTNVGIGTTAPTERLHVVGNGLFTGNVTFSGALNGNGSGLTSLNAGNITTGTLALARGGTGSTTQNFVDLSTDQASIGGNKTFTGNLTVNGSLGVGTAPGFKFDVLGRSRFRQNFNDTGSLNSAGFWLYQNTTPGSDRAFIGMESDSIVGLYGNSGGGWGLAMNTLSGNVGIGTSAPVGNLHINVPGSSNPISALTVDVGTFGTGGNAVNSYFFKVRDVGGGPTPAFLIRGDGNVGIGTNAPGYRLDVVDSTGFGLRVQTTNTPGANVASFGANGNFQVDSAAGGAGGRLWITQDGRVFIGNQPGYDPSVEKLYVYGGQNIAGAIVVHGVSTFNSPIVMGYPLSSVALGTVPLCRNSSSQISQCNPSSLRYKTDITPFTRGLDIVNRLRPVNYKWKQDLTSDIGLIAEEVAEVEPLFTFKNDKAEIEGVRYDRLTVVLVNAVKEQQGEIDRQRQEINAIKEQQAQIDSQKKKIDAQQKQIDELKRLICELKSDASVCKGKEEQK